MTTQHHDQTEDEAFDDFLQGRGELVKQLKALSQLSPSAALDAAILASAKAAVAQAALSKQVAANDPVSSRKSGFLSRFRMPLALAASLMVAVLVSVQWHAQSAYQAPIQVAQMPATEPAPTSAAAVPQLAQADTKTKAVSEVTSKNMPTAPTIAAAKQSNSVAASQPAASEKKVAVQVTQQATANATVNAALKPTAERTNAAPTQLAQADTSQMRFKSAAIHKEKAAAAPAPASALAPAPVVTTMPQIAGNLPKEPAKAAAVPAQTLAAPSTESPAKTDSQEKQKAWLARIEEMIKTDSRKEAVAEWEKFEKAYPAYPVPEKLKAQIKALKN